jgi:hypothetical protein
MLASFDGRAAVGYCVPNWIVGLDRCPSKGVPLGRVSRSVEDAPTGVGGLGFGGPTLRSSN